MADQNAIKTRSNDEQKLPFRVQRPELKKSTPPSPPNFVGGEC